MPEEHHSHEVEEVISDVNVTPLADITLTLLIMIMIITPMVMQAMITVNASKPSIQVVESQKKDLTEPVYIDVGENLIFLNKELQASDDEFVQKIKELLGRDASRKVMVTVSPNAKHGRVVQILDLAKMNGAGSLTLVPRKKF